MSPPPPALGPRSLPPTPHPGARKLAQLSAEEIDEWLATKAKTLSTDTLHRLLSILRQSEHAGLQAEEWTPRGLRHSFVSLLSSAGIPIEYIAHLVGHANTRTTEKVSRKELRQVLRRGAKAMMTSSRRTARPASPQSAPVFNENQAER